MTDSRKPHMLTPMFDVRDDFPTLSWRYGDGHLSFHFSPRHTVVVSKRPAELSESFAVVMHDEAGEDRAQVLLDDHFRIMAPQGFQKRMQAWLLRCFGPEIASDKLERTDRFIEEALELAQAGGYSAERAHALVEYVFGRPKGELAQEVGGVMCTLAALCSAHGIDMQDAAETELARIWGRIEAIRAKQAAKPTGSALPC
jgi:NTP pyrophosphatase (non-canonical NTP hydrolase)